MWTACRRILKPISLAFEKPLADCYNFGVNSAFSSVTLRGPAACTAKLGVHKMARKHVRHTRKTTRSHSKRK